MLLNFLPYLIILSMIFFVLYFLKRFFALESRINKTNKKVEDQNKIIDDLNKTIKGHK